MLCAIIPAGQLSCCGWAVLYIGDGARQSGLRCHSLREPKGGDAQRRESLAIRPYAAAKEAVLALCPSQGMTEQSCSLVCRYTTCFLTTF